MIKKISAGLCLAIALAACNQANTQTQLTADSGKAITKVNASNAASMKFETDAFDFGKINEGEKVTHEFKFVNTGKSPLIITDAYATCGCTVPEVAKEPIQPGASSTIKVTFNSAGKTGLQDKLITVVANTLPAENRLHLTGEVKASETATTTAKK